MSEAGNIHILSTLALGFILGLRHALDADHLVAVSTIVSERKGVWSSSLVGLLWGVGHTMSLLIVGLGVIFLDIQIPERMSHALELVVALMLIVLGVNVLRKLRSGAVLHVHTHGHGDHLHIHPHVHSRGLERHEHPEQHQHTQVGKKPLIVGMIHGLAGSAGLMLVVLATITSVPIALLYIGLFGVGSIGGMFVMSTLIGIPFAYTVRIEKLNRIIRFTAGVVSISFGLFLAWEIGASGLFL